MNIVFIYAKGREERYAGTIQGHAATEFFYGALELEASGHIITRYELGHGHSSETKLWQKIAEQFYRWRLTPTRTNSATLAELHEMCPALNKQDVIVATTTAAAFGLATFKLFGLIQRPIVAIHCGIANFQLSWPRRKLNAYALKNMWTQLFGEGELADVKKFYDVPDSRIEVNQFGVDTEFWQPADGREEYILSVGNDERRDYGLLIQAAREVNRNFKILTRHKLKDVIPPNVEIIRGGWHEQTLTDEGLRSLYQKASIVVIPLKNSPQPSGQSVCLQAMACGKPIILTQTDGLWSQEMMRDGENVMFVPADNISKLVSAIKDLKGNTKKQQDMGMHARRTAVQEGNIKNFARRLGQLCQRSTGIESSLDR